MKVSNMKSSSGNKVANQFYLTDNDGNDYFQSYNSVIAKRSRGQIYLDEYYWNYSKTTAKYRNQFLNETTKETERKINDGTYTLINLN